MNNANHFRNAIVEYIRNWKQEIDIALEKPVGYRFVDNPRVIDILLHYNGKFMGIEAKYQEVEGTAYQKLFYTLEDCKNAPIPVLIVFAGKGIKTDVKSRLIMSGYGIEVEFIDGRIKERKPMLLQRIAIELGINWFNLV
ncbi:MAG: hypothetical protein NUV41_16590 [Eubacteriales bacterium]|jgi:hypothetical protein|nr:hypothetical protein [Eubacteriales bacterium]